MGSRKGGEKPQPKKKAPSNAAHIDKAAPKIPGATKVKSLGQTNEQDRNESHHKPLHELSEKHLYFAKRYALNENACKAARESGFNEWYGSVILSKDPLIIKEVERIRKSRAAKFEVNQDRIIAELVKVAFGNLDDFLTLQSDGTPVIDCHDIGRSEMAALAEVTQDIYTERTGLDPDDVERVKKTKIKLHSKTQALEQLSRIFKMFGDESGLDKDTPEMKARKIAAALKAMREVDGQK